MSQWGTPSSDPFSTPDRAVPPQQPAPSAAGTPAPAAPGPDGAPAPLPGTGWAPQPVTPGTSWAPGPAAATPHPEPGTAPTYGQPTSGQQPFIAPPPFGQQPVNVSTTGVGSTAPGAGPASGYGQPPSGHGQPTPGYGQPAPAWGSPAPTGGPATYGQPSAGFGQSAPGWGGQRAAYPTYGSGPAAWGPPQRTEGTAIGALVCGLTSLVAGIPAIPGLILGIVALRKIRRTGNKGKGMATAGIITSVLGILFTVAAVWFAASNGGFTALQPYQTLKVGDCTAISSETFGTVGETGRELHDQIPLVDCAEPHTGEVIAVWELPDGSYPGAEAIQQQATTECTQRGTAVINMNAPDLAAMSLVYTYPLKANWLAGDHSVECFTLMENGTTTGSVLLPTS